MKKQALHPRTAHINSKQKNQSKQARQQALKWLTQKFPNAFDTQACIRPFKKGMMQDILMYADEAQEHGISRSKLREAVVEFTRHIAYLASLKAQEYRIDLEGKELTQVTKEEAELAGQKIKKRIEKTIKNTKKTQNHLHHKPSTPHHTSTKTTLPPHHYPQSAAIHASHSTKRHLPSIAIKPSRSYDPHAIARLKEKLGILQKERSLDE